jgi:hypothetical protein
MKRPMALAPGQEPKEGTKTQTVVDRTWTPRPGDNASLFLDGASKVYVASDMGSYYDLLKTMKANDTVGLKRMLDQQRITAVEVKTPILVVELSRSGLRSDEVTAVEARILAGPEKDKKVLVPLVWVARLVEVPIQTRSSKSKSKAKGKPAAIPAKEGAKPANAASKADVALKVGENLEVMGKSDAALKAYRDLVKEFPGTPQAEKAKGLIDALTGVPK